MEKLCKELDDVKDEMEKLKAEYRIKADLSESLRKAHNEQLIKLKEANLEIEKQAQDINAKAEEISVTKQMYEDVKNSLNEKESAFRVLRSANDKLRADHGEKLQQLEGENRDLVIALDESTTKSQDQEQKIHAYQEEIEGLKRLLSVSQKKCLEAEQRALASKDLRQREDMLMKLEEENGKFKDQLKWKREHFKHLEEAHDKMQGEFRLSKKEWEKEKLTLTDEISSLQTSLNSQTRIAESLKSRLEMCNQALAHEESRRKLMEVEISESKTCYENVFADYQEAKSKIESMSAQRDEEIASLRNSLGTKLTLFKEMEFRVGHLEQENQELKGSLKELREAQIQAAGSASSLSKLRNKLRSLEQLHKECTTNLKARETEWSCQMEKLMADLNECRSMLECKDNQILNLQTELGTKQTLLNEMEFRVGHLEPENQELKGSLEELRETQIQDAGAASSLSMLHNELRGVEQVHNECSMNLKAIETEWSSRMEKLMADLNECRSELDCEEKKIQDLQMELEHCHSSILQLQLDNEEMSVLLMVFKSGFSDSQSNLSNSKAEMGLHNKESEEQIAHLLEQLKQKDSSLVKAYDEIEKGREVNASLAKKIESLDVIEQQYFLMQKELERYKEMLEESSGQYLQLKQNENSLKEDLRNVSDALAIAKSELAELTSELAELTSGESEAEFELARRRSLTERLKFSIVENQVTRKEMEASLLAQVEIELTLKQENENLIRNAEEKDKLVDDLQQQISLLEQELARRKMEICSLANSKTPNDSEQEKERFLQNVQEKEKSICNLQQQIDSMEQKFLEREFEAAILAQTKEKSICNLQQQIDSMEQEFLAREFEAAILAQTTEDKTSEQEKEKKEKLHMAIEEKNQIIEDLSHRILLLHESWDKITTIEAVAELEIQVKSLMVAELEDEINNLQQKLELQEKSLFSIKRKEEHLEAALEAKQLEINQLENQERISKGTIEKLKSKMRDLLDHIGEFSDHVSEFSELKGSLDSIVQSIDKRNELVTNFMGDADELYDLDRENVHTLISSSGKKIEPTLEGRSPLKERNIGC